MSHSDDFPTLVSSLQASTVEWTLPSGSFRLSGSAVFSGANLRNRYLRFMQVLHRIEELFSVYRLSPNVVLLAWCASLQDSGVAPHFVGLLVDLVLQGNLPHLALARCLRLVDVFLDWTTRPNAGGGVVSDVNGGLSCPVLIPAFTVAKWVEQTWNAMQALARDTSGTSTPTATAGLCGALQLLPVLLRWCSGPSPLPAFRRGMLPHPVNMVSEEARVLAFRCLPALLRHQPSASTPQGVSYEAIEYVRRGCVKSSDVFVRLAAASSLRGALESGLRVSSPAVAYALVDMLLALCDDVAPFDMSDEVLADVGVAIGYLLAFYQSDFTADALSDILQAAAPSSKAAAAAEERVDVHRRGAGNASSAAPGAAGAAGASGAGRVRWRYFGGADAVEGSRVVQRCFNERMTRTAQRALATALATLCATFCTPATTASAIQCCFVLIMPIEGDARAYMPRLLADAIQEWAEQLPSNGYRVVLADVLRGYVQRLGEDKAVVRTAMVALQGVVRTLSSSLEIGFNVAEDVVAAVNATPSLLHTGVEVLGAVARTNLLYARQLQHQCARADSAEVANTLAFQLHIRALLVASADAADALQRDANNADDALGEEDRVSLVHVCLRLLLRLSRGDPPRAVQDIHYRQAELIFRLTQLIYDLLHGSPSSVLHAVRDELQPCTLGFMNLLVSSPAPSIAFYKAATAACAMLRRAPVVSDTERMLAVGFLESRLVSQDGVARQHVDAAASHAATAYFAVSKGALYCLVAATPWPTCRDDGSLRWLAAQALKDISRACAAAAPVLSFSAVHGAAVASAAQSMRLVRSSLHHRHAAAASSISAAAETPAHPLEECGGHAVLLLQWTLRHFAARGAAGVCVSLLASVYTDVFAAYAVAVNEAAPVDEQAQQAARREMGVWNALCTAHALLRAATTRSAAALWADAAWRAEVGRWHTAGMQLVAAASQEAVEVRLLAVKVLALSLASTGQVDVFTSQTVASVAQGPAPKPMQLDMMSALMVLCEAHSHVGEASGTLLEASPTLPLATSLLSEAWRRLASTAATTNTAPLSSSVLVLMSLRLALIYPAEVEAALSDSLASLLLAPMTSANSLWWSSLTAPGMLTVIVQLWTAFKGVNDAVLSVPQCAALLLVPQCLSNSAPSLQMTTSAATAALDAVEAFTRHQDSNEEGSVMWRRLLHLCLEQATHVAHEDECAPSPLTQHKGRAALHRLVVQKEAVSLRLSVLWYRVLVGNGACPLTAAAVADAVSARHLTVIDVAVQADLATTAAARRGWVLVAQAMCAALLPHDSLQAATTTLTTHNGSSSSSRAHAPPTLTPAFCAFLRAVHVLLQSRSPDVQVDVAKRDGDMFVAVDDGVADGGRGGGGGGSDSDDAGDYAEEFGEENTGGILSGNNGADGAGRNGNAAAPAAANGAALSAGTMTFDVAVKEAAMWVLYDVLRAVGSDRAHGETSRRRADEARRAVLPMVVAAAQLVEVHPEVHIATVAVLHEVLVLWGNSEQLQERVRPAAAAVLLPWKTQLVVSLTTVLQHGLLSLEWCTALAIRFSRCNLADTSSCRRVLRSLLTLLHACLRLQERQRGFLLGESSGPGHIIVAIAKVAQSPAMAAASLEAAQGAFVRTLVSPPCQAALTLLCERFVTAVSLANGYVPLSSALGGWGRADDDGAAATASVYGARMSMTAGDVLQAIAFMTAEPLAAALGPALRYATGCLACLVLAALPATSAAAESERGVLRGGLDYVVRLSGFLATSHQRILAQLAQQRLLTTVRGWEGQTATAFSEGVALLLRAAAVAAMPKAQAEELLDALLPYVEKTKAEVGGKDWVEAAASLLCVGLAAHLDAQRLGRLIALLPADALVGGLPAPLVARLERLTAAYAQSGKGGCVRVLTLAGPAGLLLVGRCVAAGALPSVSPPLLDRATWSAVLHLLRSSADPVKTMEFLWCPPVSLVEGGGDSAARPSLGGCVAQHTAEATALLALLASLDAPVAAAQLQDTATFILHCGPLMSEVLMAKMPVKDDATAALSVGLYEVLLYVVTVLSAPLAPAYAVALTGVGRYLVRTVAPAHGASLREAIQRLGPAKAARLRAFMEESCH